MIPIIIQDNFLSSEECKQLIDFYKSRSHASEKYSTTYPLVIKTDEHKLLTEKINKVGFNVNNTIVDWFQIVRWPSPNSGKNLHKDISSVLSSVIYLNDDYDGGHTYFKDGTSFAPAIGRAIFFDGNIYPHGVSHIDRNDRYTVATWMKKCIIL